MEKRVNNHNPEDLVLRAIRIAEYAHRNRPQGPHYRKAPKGEDRPYYFVHLAEVGWLLSGAGRSHELVAAGFLHDIIEDCGYTADQLEEEIGFMGM
jgi:(p)ppGpp synthase/HD superfamily hydrolase